VTTSATGRASDRVALVLGGTGMAALLAVAATRGLAVMAREVRFDVDPALDPTPLAVLGPAGSLTLDVLLLLACAAVLAAAAIRRRGADWRLLLLAAVPLPVLALHGLDDLGVAVADVVGAAVQVHVDEPPAIHVVEEVALTAVDHQVDPEALPVGRLAGVPVRL